MNYSSLHLPRIVAHMICAIVLTASATVHAVDEKKPIIAAESTVIGTREKRDLELAASFNHEHAGVFAGLDATHTHAGKHQLYTLLENPITDVAVLKERQNVTTTLATTDTHESHARLAQLLEQFRAHEHGLTYFTDPCTNPIAKTIIDKFYYQSSFLSGLNTSPVALDARNIFKHASLLSPVVEHLMMHFAVSYLWPKPAGASHDHSASCGCGYNPEPDAQLLRKIALGSLYAAHLGMHAMSVKDIYENMKTEKQVVNELYKKICAARMCVKLAQEIAQLLHELNLDPQFADLAINNTELLEFSANESFDAASELGFVSRVGTTLHAYRLLQNQTELLATLHTAVGKVDAFASVAQWRSSMAANNIPTCLVNFVDVQQPTIVMTNFWNVGLPSNKAITNSLAISDAHPRTLVVTGPNKSGKSTALKAVALNIILAQTFGIAAAADLTMTPFAKVITNITVTDDIAHDKSTFTAELIQAQECLNTLGDLQPNQHALMIVDDGLFKGTTAEKGQQLALQFVQEVGATPHCIALLATHMPVLTTLEAQAPQQFKNYQVALTTTRGKTASTFSLIPGIADQSRIFDIIQDDFDLVKLP